MRCSSGKIPHVHKILQYIIRQVAKIFSDLISKEMHFPKEKH